MPLLRLGAFFGDRLIELNRWSCSWPVRWPAWHRGACVSANQPQLDRRIS